MEHSSRTHLLVGSVTCAMTAAASVACAQTGIEESVGEVASFVTGLFSSRFWPPTMSLVVWGTCLALLSSQARNRTERARPAGTEWMVLLGIPIIAGLLTVFLVAQIDASRAPQFACSDLVGHTSRIIDGYTRELVVRGIGLCQTASKGPLPFALETGRWGAAVTVALVLSATFVAWLVTNFRVVDRSST